MKRMVPPAGVPVRMKDIINAVGARLRPNKYNDRFMDIVREVSGSDYCAFTNSGRTANLLILKALKEISEGGRDEVVIPAYTCFTVPASIVRAGLKIRLVDILPETMDYDYDALENIDFSRTLAILPCNLFGIVSDWSRIRRAVESKTVFLVDDSAQTLGIPRGGSKMEPPGDIGFYSLGRGKNMSVYSGGIIFTNNPDLAEKVGKEISRLPLPGPFGELGILTKFMFYSVMLHPSLYWIPDGMPFLGLGKTIYDENFPVGKLSALQICAGPIMFEKFPELQRIRTENSNTLAGEIGKIEGFFIPGWSENSNIPFIRLPVLAHTGSARDEIIRGLRSIGISSSGMYPSTISKIEGLDKHLAAGDGPFNGAEQISKRLFTLPTHPYLKKDDIDRIIDFLNKPSLKC